MLTMLHAAFDNIGPSRYITVFPDLIIVADFHVRRSKGLRLPSVLKIIPGLPIIRLVTHTL
jgi:hypothetical protein